MNITRSRMLARRARVEQTGADRREEINKWPLAGKEDIYKCQRPLMTTSTVATYLLYNKSREVEWEEPPHPGIASAMGKDLKVYFLGRLEPDRARPGAYKVRLLRKVADRNW